VRNGNLFVGVVDAELLEAVDVERFEAVDVEHADEDVIRRSGLLVLLQVIVERHDQPVKEARVEQHCKRVPL